VQGASFAIVGLLVAGLRRGLAREQALSRQDPLSGLSNGRAFFEEGARLLELCRRSARPITLAYLDLDNFKQVNDDRGHAAGDDMLRAFADQIRTSVRASDIPARLGGDEFALLLPELGAEEAQLALSRLHAALQQCLSTVHPGVSVSIGAATFLVIPDDLEAMVRSADALMYAAKRSGKNQLRLEVVGVSSPASAR
jgi:diguanylate cyclase (GGDEF)-like protein